MSCHKVKFFDQVVNLGQALVFDHEVRPFCNRSLGVCFTFHMLVFRITNLKCWGGSEAIITKTLQLLSDLSVGYSSVRKLVKLDAIMYMLDNHKVCDDGLVGQGAATSTQRSKVDGVSSCKNRAVPRFLLHCRPVMKSVVE